MAKFKNKPYDIRDFLGLLLKLFGVYVVIASFYLSDRSFLFNLVWGISILLGLLKSDSSIDKHNQEE